MITYQILQPATFNAGILGLSEAQAARRRHALKALAEKGLYEIVAPVQFKAGETVAYAGDLPKAMAEAVVDVVAIAAEKAAVAQKVAAKPAAVKADKKS